MRKVGKGPLTAVLVLGLFTAVAVAQPADSGPAAAGEGGWWGRWFGARPGPAAKAPAEVAEKPVVPVPSEAESVAQEQERHFRAYLRRLDVIDKLRQVALDTGNDDLARQADELDQQVNTLYNRQVAGGAGGSPRQDMATLDRRLNTTTARPRPSPQADVEARAARMLEGTR